MVAPVRRLPRWSKKTDELVQYVAQQSRPSLKSELGNWLEESSRFRSFITDNQDKVRKKLSTSDEQTRLDVRAELLVAYLILGDRRFQLRFEAYGAGRRGPDLSATFRENQRFNLEVTRLRATDEGPASNVSRLANVISGKLRQFPRDTPNILVITTRGPVLDGDSLAEAYRLLKTQKFPTAPDLQAHYPHLGGVFVLNEGTSPPRAAFSANREARHPLSVEAEAGLRAVFTSKEP